MDKSISIQRQGKMTQGKMSLSDAKYVILPLIFHMILYVERQGKMSQGKMTQGKMSQGKMTQGKMTLSVELLSSD